MSEWKRRIYDKSLMANAKELSLTLRLFQQEWLLHPELMDLHGFDPLKINSIHLTTILRVTANNKHEIKGWNEAFEAVQSSIKYEAKDPQVILLGMFKSA